MATTDESIYTDPTLIADLRAGGAKREKAVTHLFDTNLGFVYKVMKEKRLSQEEARDAYTDAVVVVCEQVAKGKFRGESKISTYLYRIFLFKAVDIIRKKATHSVESVPEVPDLADPAADALKKLGLQQQAFALIQLMDSLGGKCRQILLDWAYHGYSMEEIAQRAGLKDAASAATQKYKCFKRLQSLLPSHYKTT